MCVSRISTFTTVSDIVRLLKTLLMCRVNHLEQRQDVIDAYEWIQGNLNKTLKELGSDVTIDFSRCIVGGSSAGGTNSLWLVSLEKYYT